MKKPKNVVPANLGTKAAPKSVKTTGAKKVRKSLTSK